jgi:hypothetical protein
MPSYQLHLKFHCVQRDHPPRLSLATSVVMVPSMGEPEALKFALPLIMWESQEDG